MDSKQGKRETNRRGEIMLKAVFSRFGEEIELTDELWQYDFGQKIQVTGIELPDVCEVHFQYDNLTETKTVTGYKQEDALIIDIPNEALTSRGIIKLYIYLVSSEEGRTVNVAIMHVNRRMKPEGFEVPEDIDLFHHTLLAADEYMHQAKNAKENAEKAADRAESARDLAEGSARTAQGSAEAAEQAKNEAVEAAESIKNTKVPTKTSELENDSHFLAADTEISWGRKADTTIGEQSVALGVNVEASGVNSHAEGSNTKASGSCSHAEGRITTASGYASHAEGMVSTASGQYCHAEGYGTISKGDATHAEGRGTTASGFSTHAEGSNTIASGMHAHAEGNNTKAGGVYSHAEGSNTEAKGNTQHVQGKYNVIDESNKYAHIVGGGTSNDKRKNIHTLDWEGNAEYAGDVAATVNGKKVSMSTLADIFLQPGAAAHNAICRGKKLGNALTSEMLASIRDGSFNDLYVCDYIETEDNIYRFMDFDYFLGCCSSASGGRIERHHAILVPDKVMSSSAIDNYPEATQPKETHMYVNKLPEVTQTLKGIFGNDNVAMMDRVITKTVNGESTGWDWVNVGADLLTEVMVMGHSSWGQWVGFQTGIMKGQLAGFRYSHYLMCSNEDYWLRDKRSATNYALISSDGYSSSDTGSLQHGVRPFFVIW